MTGNSYWLRRVADKYGIEGVDRKVIDQCADKLERLHVLNREMAKLTVEAVKLTANER